MKIFIILGVLFMSCNQSLTPPDAVKKPFQTKEHGNSRVDNYNWMRLSDDQKSTKPFSIF